MKKAVFQATSPREGVWADPALCRPSSKECKDDKPSSLCLAFWLRGGSGGQERYEQSTQLAPGLWWHCGF
eukprot:1174171-Prymnesium_polylepis.1